MTASVTTFGSVSTEKSGIYLKVLCNHFRKKVNVDFTGDSALVSFPTGNCVISRSPDEMQFRIEADDKAGVAQVKYILESHVKMFSRKDPLLISWGADQE